MPIVPPLRSIRQRRKVRSARYALAALESLEPRTLLSAFTDSNVNGPWTFAGTSQFGSITFDNAGHITGGSLVTNSDTTVTPAGSYAISGNGAISLTLNSTINVGAMTTTHDIIAVTQTNAIHTLSVLVSGGGKTFSNADLTGSWTYSFNDDTDTFSGGGTIKFDGHGHITGGTVMSGRTPNPITGGTYTVNADGTATFGVIVKNGSPFQFSGAIDASKDAIAVSATDIQSADASQSPDFTMLVHSQGSYSKTDLTGNWAINTELGHGTLVLSGGGVINTSTFTDYQGHTITLTGTYTVSSSGAVTAKIRSDDNGTIETFNMTGAMNASHNLVSLNDTLDTPLGNVAVLISGNDHAPTLTGMAPFSTATGGQPFTISYAQLVTNSTNFADADHDTLDFQVNSPASGTTIALNGTVQNSFPITVAPGDTLTYTPAAAASGNVTAFTVVAFDGTLASAKAIPVIVKTIPEPTLSAAATTATAQEVNNGIKGIGVVTFSRTGATTQPLTVHYTISGDANDDTNFDTLSGSAIIPVGKSSIPVQLIPLDNLNRSGNLTVTLTLAASDPNYIVGTKNHGAITIVDNNLAPLSLAGESLSATFTAGVAPLATSGSYQLFFAAAGNQYVSAGGPTLPSGLGTYSYVRTSSNTATLSFSGTNGSGSGTLTFSSISAAVYSETPTSGPGSQTSKLKLLAAPKTNFAPASVSGLAITHTITSGTGLLPTKGSDENIFSQSSSKLVVVGTAPVPSGLDAYTYEKFGPNLGIVTFTNDDSTNGFTTVLYTSATKGTFVTTLDAGQGTQHGSFTHVTQPAGTLAPATLDGSTLHNAISSGAAPFAVKGTSTIVLAATSYTFTQTTPIANSTGAYTYEKLTPSIGYILFNDTLLASSSDVLQFTSATKATFVFAKDGSPGWQRGAAVLS